ncbi:MAG: hypothetical protein K6G28_06890 [Acholeplasmatales bacterium]|nr:hypothetical protein [Acholeplasmatales bacterium]
MFLSLLTRKEKLKFLDLAIYMIDIDGDPTDAERRLLSKINGELGRDIVDEYTFTKSKSVEESLEFFKDKADVVKNIVYLNLVEISMLEDLYNTSEHAFLEKVQKTFPISQEKRRQLISVVYDERDLREKALREIKY